MFDLFFHHGSIILGNEIDLRIGFDSFGQRDKIKSVNRLIKIFLIGQNVSND